MLQETKFSCHNFEFGTVNEILTVSSNLKVPQPVSEESEELAVLKPISMFQDIPDEHKKVINT